MAQLTGRRFLGNFTSDDQQFRALMDAGVTFATAFNLRPGIALTAEQIARLTSDIVWLQQETVTLPGVDGKPGTQTVALVPQIYLKPRAGDLSPSGGLISGASVNINTADLNNSGTILGRKVVQINADTINNLGGTMGGDTVALTATQDINNTGGTITAQDKLTLQAGRDINNTSTTATASTGDSRNGITNTTVDRVAGLYVTGDNGVLLASAGRDINLVASVVKNSGTNSQTTLVAQNDINLTTQQTRQTNNLERDAGNFRRATSTAESGSSIEGAGNVTLSAGNDVNARAARVEAGKTLDVAAANNIILQAGQATTNVDQMASASGKDLFFSSSIQTRRQEQSATAQVSSFTGQSTQVVADNTLASIGAKLEATGVDTGTGTLRVEGKNNTLLYEVQNFSQTSVTTQTKTGLGFMFDPLGIGPDLENKTVTDARATSTAIGTQLVSTQKIEIGVGNKTELRGAEVEAPQIAFVQTDPSKAGELILGGSTNTTQTSHTEKTETAGVYQEMKGNGSTVETLNQTQIKGNVSFDAALKITVQIPDTKGGQALKSQINALVTQGNGVGLDYLNALANNPNVKWDQVALAHEKWSYDQGGLTGAGAALLTIVVTYFTAGMGSGAASTLGLGTTTTVAGVSTFTASATGLAVNAAANAAISSLASQAAVAMVNNKGDLGKTLEQLGSEQSIKNLLTTMVTAGALDKLNSTMGWQSVTAKSPFIDQFQKNLGNNLTTDMLNSALAGKPFDEKTFANSLKGALISTGNAQGAFAIGSADLDAFTNKLAHAALGCAGGVAMGGSCNAGAVGAVVGELVAEYINPTADPALSEKTIGYAKILAAVAGVVVGGGGDNAVDVNVAATAGANAAENNFLSHPKLAARNAALATLRKDADKNFIQKLLNPTKGVLSAAEEATALQWLDKRSDDLLTVYRISPGKLTTAETNELGIYLGDYAQANGIDAAKRLLQTGPTTSMESGDVPELLANAKGLLRINTQQKGQAAIGDLALSAAPGGVGTLLRLVQAAQSGLQIGTGIAETLDDQPSAGLMNIGLGLMGALPVAAVEIQAFNAAKVASKAGTNGATTAVADLEVIGAGNGIGKPNLINPTGRTDNCTACVAANILNKIKGNPIDGLVTAQQVEARFGYAGAEAKLGIGDSVAYIEKATNTTAIKTPIAAPNAPVGYYAVYAETASGGHVIYGQVLPNGRYFFYDPQIGGNALTLQQARALYNLKTSYLMKPNP